MEVRIYSSDLRLVTYDCDALHEKHGSVLGGDRSHLLRLEAQLSIRSLFDRMGLRSDIDLLDGHLRLAVDIGYPMASMGAEDAILA